MTDPISTAARAAGRRLEPEDGPGLLADVEAALATRESPATPLQYADPVALGGLIVAIATLAWTIYSDLRKHTTAPSAEVITRTVRVTLRRTSPDSPPDRIIDLVVSETIQAAAQQEPSPD